MENNSLRERKKIKTREKLIQIATRLFLEKGFESTTVDEIVEQAELSQRTFFRYFSTKESVVLYNHALREQQLEILLNKDAGCVTPFEQVEYGIQRIFELYEHNRQQSLDEHKIINSSPILLAHDIELDLNYEKIIAQRLMNWNGEPYMSERKARVASAAICGAVRAIMVEWFIGECTIDYVEASKEYREIIHLLASVNG